MDAGTQQGQTGGKLNIEKLAEDQIACLRFQGQIGEDFDGKKASATVKAQTLILDMGEVYRITSFGLREWAEFIRAIERTAKNIYLVECPPKVVDQLNMVANFAGKGLVYSFYAPYRCDFCDIDRLVPFQVDRDREAIKSMRPPEQPCEVCGNPEYLDEDPATFFTYFARQSDVELEPEVASFMASKLGYTASEAPRRLQIEKHVDGRSTYLKLSGSLDGSFPREKIAEGLEGTIVIDVSGIGGIDPAGAAEWRGLIAMVAPFVDRIYLLGCPPAFLERLARREDLGEDVEVLSFSMPYACPACHTTAAKTVDVAEHYEILKFATPPEMKCDDCKSQTTCVASESLLSQLPALPEPTAGGEIRKFIKEAQQQKKKERAAAAAAHQAPRPQGGVPTYVIALLTVSSIVVLGLAAFVFVDRHLGAADDDDAPAVATEQEQDFTEQRPDWITTGRPGSAYCSDRINLMLCVGVSEYWGDRDDARDLADDAARDEMASAIGLRIDLDAFDEVHELYSEARSAALGDLEDARATDQEGAAIDSVRRGREAVAAVLEATAGPALPAQPRDWYWEEYDPRPGTDRDAEFLVFSLFDVGMEELRRMVERYEEIHQVEGSEVLTVFPSLAWLNPDLEGGALVLEPGGALGRAGVERLDVVTEVGGEAVTDAGDLEGALRAAGSAPDVTVWSPKEAAQEL